MERGPQKEKILSMETPKNLEIISAIDALREKEAQDEVDCLIKHGKEEEIKEVLKDTPKEVRKELEETIRFLLKREHTDIEVLEKIKKEKDLHMNLYITDKGFLRMYNREFSNHKLSEALDTIIKKDNLKEEDLSKIARFNLDMNGLKTLNDIGGHSIGNKALKIFSDILKKGKTTNWLQEMGLEVTTSIDGGDEFGIVIFGDINLNEKNDSGEKLVETIKKKFFEEVKNTDVSRLIDFSNEEVRKKLEIANIKIEDEFKFEISTSVGAVTFDEIVPSLSKKIEEDVNYEKLIGGIVGKMIHEADMRGIRHKEDYKKDLTFKNPTLRKLYGIGRENLEIAEENKWLKEENEKLKKELKGLKQK